MTVRQIVLSVLTVVVVLFSAGPALINSIQEQQITDRLELYQTDLLLQASELKVAVDNDQWVPVQVALVGQNPGDTALKAYQRTRETAQSTLETLQAKADALETTIDAAMTDAAIPDAAMPNAAITNAAIPSSDSPSSTLAQSSGEETAAASAQNAALSQQKQQLKLVRQNLINQQTLINQLDINIGVIQAHQGDVAKAQQTWSELSSPSLVTQTLATMLGQLWSNPPEIATNTESQIRRGLTGWFRDRTLTRLYTLQDNTEALAALQQNEQQTAQQTVRKLVLLSAGPVIGCITGVGLIIFLIVQRFIKGQDAILADGQAQTWETPWNWEITWQVVIVGFFVVGQFVVPILFQIFKPLVIQLGHSAGLVDGRISALSTLVVYSLMSLGTIAVLYVSIRDYKPFEKGWFRIKLLEKWWAWGLAGYVVAVPVVIGVSVVNQQIWQGRGGSNPLLQTVLEEGDGLALGIFFFTAAIAAPIFEEILFRGFILPSLTRYTSTWGAIALSAFLFAAAHLSVSEILPLMVLGMVLGFVYTRSKNLLAPMMVHSLWNSATMAGLFILGSSVT